MDKVKEITDIMVVIFTPLRGLFFVGNVMTKRELELMYDRTSGQDRERHYREWCRLVAQMPSVTAPKAITATIRKSRS